MKLLYKIRAIAFKLTWILLQVISVSNARAQHIPSPAQLSSPATVPGKYFNETSITLLPGFSATATSGHSYSYAVGRGCVPLANSFSHDKNYIATTTPRVAMQTVSTAGKTNCDMMQTVQYFDDIGRPLQTVQVEASPFGMDVVEPFAYDAFGREATKYLPYASQTTANGSYRPDAVAKQSSFYAGPPAGSGVSTIASPYSVTVFESSPLNRMLEQGAPGNDWQPGTTGNAGHTVKKVYVSNNTTALTDTANSRYVALYTVNASGNLSRGSGTAARYDAGELYLTVTRDENWKSGRGGTMQEYKDKEGHVVLKRTFNYTGSTLQILSTYYVYDVLGNLRYVLPPKSGADGGLPNATELFNLCYQYRYDERNRLTQKKLPGKDWEYMVYNRLDQVVLSQDGVQRNTNQWTVNKYDALGRLVMTGLWNAGSVIALATLQNSIYAADQWDSRDYSNTTTGYAVTSYPATLSSRLTINYFDDYDLPALPATYDYSASASKMTRGMPTATKTAILNSTSLLWKVSYYDDLGRNIRNYKQHNQGGGTPQTGDYDLDTSKYDFTNEVVASLRQHYNAAVSTADAAVTIANTYTYDHMGHKLKTFEQINNSTNVLLAQDDYNETGQLETKHLGSENKGSSFLQNIGYTYNERGWLKTAGSTSNLFSMELRYNSSTDDISKQYNGNIAEMLYKGPLSGSKSLIYTYDQLNRLTKAASTGGTLNEQLTYDTEGNIMSLTRGGTKSAALAYNYEDSGVSNRLQTVTNNGNDYRSYAYDDNGNATSDGGSKTIAYNILNLPRTVTQGTTTLATYTYDADGNKLRNTGSDGNWDYIDGIVYKNDAIAYISTDEGRAVPDDDGYHYEYNLQDNLGNIRLSFDKNPAGGALRTLQEDEYYSFGLRVNLKLNDNRYLYNGKEIQTDLANQYDYGARFYDPVIGRWTSADPLAEMHHEITPYNYVMNNPINFKDPMGLDTIKSNGNLTPSQFHTFNPTTDVIALQQDIVIRPTNNDATSSSNNNETRVENVSNNNTIDWGQNARRNVVSPYTLELINAIMNSSNNHHIIIKSTQRTPQEQANAMYDNILSHSLAFSYNLYGTPGDHVTHVAEVGIRSGLNRSEIIDNMTAEIITLGPQTVSRHTGDPAIINVLDISPRTITNRSSFIREVRARGINLLTPPADPAFHLEIRQPQR